MKQGLPVIAISMGDPAGVGPEIILKALKDSRVSTKCSPVILGDYGILKETSARLGLDCPLVSIDTLAQLTEGNEIPVLSLSAIEGLKTGEVSADAGRAAGIYISTGAELALKGAIDALVTAPINKESFNMGGFDYPGHTEFLAKLTKTKDYAMMLMGERLRVVLLTIHCPLMSVAERLSVEDTLRIIRLTDRSLRNDFGLQSPRIALASLNPHAGEGGLFGQAEAELLLPAAQQAREKGVDITDPLPADTLFYKALRGDYDVVVCPYHDQALIPLKMIHFEDGVNITLGLPIIRTSPDHGTAFDIAGRGIASPESLISAIFTAVDMLKARQCRNKGVADG